MTKISTTAPPYVSELPVTGLRTLQLGWGGLLDGKPVDEYAVHLVRSTSRGTPGPTLCGVDRFGPDAPGWSVGGGMTGPNIVHLPCGGCANAARVLYPGLPVAGSIGAKEMNAHLATLADAMKENS